MQDYLARAPLGFGQWLVALDYALSRPFEIAIVGEPGSANTQALLNVVRSGYRPFQVVALGEPHPDESTVPLLRDRGLVDKRPAAYVCRAFACQPPATEAERLQAQLTQR